MAAIIVVAMARQPRIYVPGLPQHVVQRGHNRQACFFATGDYVRYLHWLREAIQATGTALHAYVLMTNHVHLLLTPRDETAIPLMMMSLGRRYVLSVNKRYGRSGTLWDGRFHASIISTDSYLLACQRYIELNLVRAGIVANPAMYRRSSFKRNALGHPNDLISAHATYLELGRNDVGRQKAYLELFDSDQDGKIVAEIRLAASQNQPLGQTMIQTMVGDSTEVIRSVRPRGRPWVERDLPTFDVEDDDSA